MIVGPGVDGLGGFLAGSDPPATSTAAWRDTLIAQPGSSSVVGVGCPTASAAARPNIGDGEEAHMTWRTWLASLLLLFGVAMSADAMNGPWWLVLPGATCLVLVAPLIIDEARRRP